jgi:hypothetical protein
MSTPFTAKVHARGPIIDLRLAQTYVPGVYCLFRSAIMILIMTRTNVSEDMSILLIMCILVYVDRTTRHESVFDSNAVITSILVGHLFNLLRVREVPLETQFVVVHEDHTTGLTKMGAGVQLLYCILSALSVGDYQIRDIWMPKKSSDNFDTSSQALYVHAALMATMVFIHISPTSMSQTITVTKSLSFTILCIVWSYVVGVKNTVQTLHQREEPKVNRVSFRSFYL